MKGRIRAFVVSASLLAHSLCLGQNAEPPLPAATQPVTPATPLTLVRDQQPMAAIVLAQKPTRAARLAAHELQYHVALITGAKLPLVPDDAPVQGVRILVGESAATQALGLRNDDFRPQEYLISLRPNLLVLMGRDQDDRQAFDYANHQTFPDVFDAQATCYAVLFVSRQRSQPYHQMGVNARGVHIDLRHEGGTQPKWDSGALVFSDTTAPDRWRVQIALPLDRLVPDGAQPGQTLHFNVLRATNAQAALAWIPTFAGFHETSRFGEIILQK